MRKLKAFLVLLFSVLMSLCLFACTPTEDNPNPDDENPENPSTETNQVISAQFQSEDPAITLSEAQVQDEASRLAAVEAAVSGFRIRYNLQGVTQPQSDAVTDLELEYDFSTVDWETVGTYSVTVTLVGAGEFDCGEGVVLLNKLSLSIEHSFGEPVDGSATCEFCGAVMTDVTLEEGKYEAVTVPGFHVGATVDSTNGDLELLTPFGTIEQGGEETEVLTATAGLLRKGMTITLYGTVQHQLDANGEVTAGTEFYDYPNLGIALRDFDVSESPFPVANERYVGGMSVIVRSDGYVLMNGIGDNGNSYGQRLLAGLVGGSVETYNYSSHPSVSNTNLGSLPWAYDNTKAPADTSTWGDWAVYSSGTMADDTTYNELQDVCFQYTFRNDNVVEIVYTIYGKGNAADSVLTCRIKIPDEYADASFDTILHGEYVDMKFDRMVIIEQDMLENLTFNGLGDDAKVNYLAGEVINYADFDGNVKVQYSSSEEGVWLDPDSYSIQVLRGEEWVTLGNSDRLLATDTDFRIMVRSGSVTLYKELKLGDDGFIQSITPNNVTDVYGIEESASLGNVGFASNNEADAQVVIAPVGTAVADPDDLSQYIVLRIYGAFGTPTLPAGSIAEIVATGEGYFDVKVATDATAKTVTITGAQDTPIVIDVSGVTAPVYAVSYSIDVNGTAYNYIPANTGATVTLVYTVPTSVYETARIGVNTTQRLACTETADLVATGGELRGGYAYTMSTTTSGDNTILTITIELPAYAVGGTGSVYVNFYTTTSNLTTFYYGAPVATEGSAVVEVGGNTGYFTVSGNTLYLVVAGTSSNIQASALTTGDVFMNINAGAASGEGFVPEIINVGSTYNAIFSAFDYEDADLATSGAVTSTLTLNGTVNADNAYDYDHNYVLTTAIDLTKCGITSASDFYFEYGTTDDDMHPVHVVVANGVVTITPVTLTGDAVEIVKSNDCYTSAVYGTPVTVDGAVVFYGNLTITPAEHDWQATETHGVLECAVCGALYTDVATGFATGALAGASEKGLTISFEYVTGGTNDWSIIPVKTTTNNLIIGGGVVDPWNVTTDGLEGDMRTVATSMQSTNLYPSKAAGSQVGASPSPFVETTAGYATIVVDPSKEGGIFFYINGELKIWYTNEHTSSNDTDTTKTPVPVSTIVELFLYLAEQGGVTVAAQDFSTANFAIVEVGAADAAAVLTRYENYQLIRNEYPSGHTWNTDTTSPDYDSCTVEGCEVFNPLHGTDAYPHIWLTDKSLATFDHCIACGALHPDHGSEGHDHNYVQGKCMYCGAVDPSHTTHTYVNGACSVCGLLCGHENVTKVGDTCTVCGGTLTENSYTFTAEDLTAMNAGWAAGSRHYSLYKNSTFTFTAKFASNTNTADWSGFVTRVFTNGQATESLFFQGNLFLLDGIKSNFTVAEGHTMNETLAAYTVDKTGFTWKLTIVWESDNAFTVTLDVWEANADLSGAPSKTATQYFVVSDSVSVMDLWIGPDSATVESGSTVAQSYTYPTAE